MAVEIKDGCKIQFKLLAQTPMIHFQAEEPGATLRGSEVKPKLDRYLIRQLLISEFGNDDPKNFSILKKNYKDYFIDPDNHDALDYKISFISGNGAKNDVERLDAYTIYCWNMGVAESDQRVGLWSDPECTILCFNDELLKLIQENIEDFFLMTNFGTMQDKGFGSFLPETLGFGDLLDDKAMQRISTGLNNLTGRNVCYVACYNKGSCVPYEFRKNRNTSYNTHYAAVMLDGVKLFYGIMKSGYNFKGYSRSYLYQYMHQYFNINNEKAWMKQKGILDILFNPDKPENRGKYDREDKNSKYLRAFFGTGEGIVYNSNNTQKEVKIEGTDRERVQSIMLFKIIKNSVFITCYDIPDEMYGVEFKFSGNRKTMSICTPTKDELKGFSIDDFLEKYVNYFNRITNGDRIEINGTENLINVNQDSTFNAVREVIPIGGDNR